MYITITEYRGDDMFHVPIKGAIKIILTKRHIIIHSCDLKYYHNIKKNIKYKLWFNLGYTISVLNRSVHF